jgi:hypothetical protein
MCCMSRALRMSPSAETQKTCRQSFHAYQHSDQRRGGGCIFHTCRSRGSNRGLYRGRCGGCPGDGRRRRHGHERSRVRRHGWCGGEAPARGGAHACCYSGCLQQAQRHGPRSTSTNFLSMNAKVGNLVFKAAVRGTNVIMANVDILCPYGLPRMQRRRAPITKRRLRKGEESDRVRQMK